MKRVHRVYLPIRVWIAIAVPFVLLGIGTVGYKSIGGSEWSWLDAMYMSAITLTTVGYGETHSLDDSGRLFTIVFLFGGVFLLFYSATEIIRAVVSGQLRTILGRESVKHSLEAIRDHIIVCGLGRMGRLICQEFERQKARYVLVDRDESMISDWTGRMAFPSTAMPPKTRCSRRPASNERRCWSRLCRQMRTTCTSPCPARVLNPNIFIVARAEHEASEAKLRRVGANHVVSPYVIGGHRVAQAVLRPTVGHILEQAGRLNAADYQIEEVVIAKSSSLCREDDSAGQSAR